MLPWLSHPNNCTFFVQNKIIIFTFEDECQFLAINCGFPNFPMFVLLRAGAKVVVFWLMYPFSLYPHLLHTSAFQLGSFPMTLPTIPVLQEKHSLTLSTGPYLVQWIEQKKTGFVSTSFMEQNQKKFTVASMHIVLDNSWYQLHACVVTCQTVRKTMSRVISSWSDAMIGWKVESFLEMLVVPVHCCSSCCSSYSPSWRENGSDFLGQTNFILC